MTRHDRRVELPREGAVQVMYGRRGELDIRTCYERNPKGASMIGINQSNLTQLTQPDLDRVCAAIAAYGFTSVRFAVDWGNLANWLGKVNYGPVQRVADALRKAGLTPLPVLGIHYPFVKSPDKFAAFTQRVVDIFHAPFYEVWNEPNLWAFSIGTPADYLKYLRAAAPIIRASGAKVISSGLAAYPDRQVLWARQYAPTTWLRGLYAAGENQDYDLFGYHPYALTQGEKFVDPVEVPFGIEMISGLDALRKAYGDTRPYAFTEIGYDTAKVSVADAARWLPRQVNVMRPRAEHQWLFCWRDTPGDGGKYGLVDAAGQPKTALFDAVKPLIPQGQS